MRKKQMTYHYGECKIPKKKMFTKSIRNTHYAYSALKKGYQLSFIKHRGMTIAVN